MYCQSEVQAKFNKTSHFISTKLSILNGQNSWECSMSGGHKSGIKMSRSIRPESGHNTNHSVFPFILFKFYSLSFGKLKSKKDRSWWKLWTIYVAVIRCLSASTRLYLVQRILELYRADLIPPEKNIYFVYLFFSQHLFNPCFLVEYIFVTSYAVMSEVLH